MVYLNCMATQVWLPSIRKPCGIFYGSRSNSIFTLRKWKLVAQTFGEFYFGRTKIWMLHTSVYIIKTWLSRGRHQGFRTSASNCCTEACLFSLILIFLMLLVPLYAWTIIKLILPGVFFKYLVIKKGLKQDGLSLWSGLWETLKRDTVHLYRYPCVYCSQCSVSNSDVIIRSLPFTVYGW